MAKNKKILKIVAMIIFVAFVILAIIFISKNYPGQNNKKDIASQREKIEKVCFRENCFEVELAITDEEKAKGLMFRKELAENKGMLFIFPQEDNLSFWMKNTVIPLDIIWLNQNQEIVFISHQALPCSANQEICPIIDPKVKAKYVLEINAGLAKEISLKEGEELFFDLRETRY